MVTEEEIKQVRLAYLKDARRALDMLATNLTVGAGNHYHLWQEVRNAERTLGYIEKLINDEQGEEQ